MTFLLADDTVEHTVRAMSELSGYRPSVTLQQPKTPEEDPWPVLKKPGVAVFCASSQGSESENLMAKAYQAGRELARDYTLITGGGSGGLMAAVALGALSAGGEVFGVSTERMLKVEGIPKWLDPQHILLVEDIPHRIYTILSLAEMAIALPGGTGTLREVVEAISISGGDPPMPVGLVNWGNAWAGMKGP